MPIDELLIAIAIIDQVLHLGDGTILGWQPQPLGVERRVLVRVLFLKDDPETLIAVHVVFHDLRPALAQLAD
ncbi:MAG: hypothetical protein F4Y06_00050 [Rhodospirillales bacterium]|nr:hypothetical protein [Rhodospirillales bacterium]MYE18317.1 hypothetical protein [Rhodospirillales bacterium]